MFSTTPRKHSTTWVASVRQETGVATSALHLSPKPIRVTWLHLSHLILHHMTSRNLPSYDRREKCKSSYKVPQHRALSVRWKVKHLTLDKRKMAEQCNAILCNRTSFVFKTLSEALLLKEQFIQKADSFINSPLYHSTININIMILLSSRFWLVFLTQIHIKRLDMDYFLVLFCSFRSNNGLKSNQ